MTFSTAAFDEHRQQFLADVQAGALVFCNHSGGKDSMAMFELLKQHVPADQLIVIHADMGDRVEWEGTREHVYATTDGYQVEIAQAINKAGEKKDFLDMVEARGMWPSASTRQCTSDLKRTPCEKVIRRVMREKGASVAYNCMGIRAEESSSRAKQPTMTWAKSKKLNAAGRTVHEFNPILDMLIGDVFAVIEEAGKALHWAYEAGMSRLSCCFCVLAAQDDLRTAAALRPELAQVYVDTEARIGHKWTATKTLSEIIGLEPSAAAA